MAWNFGVQINSLTGFDGNLDSASEEGDDYTTLANQWLNDAAREIINLLPVSMLQRCAKMNSSANYTSATGVTHEERVISVVRAKDADFNAGEVHVCRQIPFTSAHKAADENSLEYAKETDPVYYYEPQTDTDGSGNQNAVLVKVLPTSSANVTKVYSIDYPTVDHSHSNITNFPDEAEYLVALRAALTAAEYRLNFEEDVELYSPLITNLRNEYQQGVLALQTRKLYTPKKDDDEG